jgi:putative PIN family toxin of toxin-antitoxin system
VTRFVIDTNVFVSALIGKKGSAADQLVRAFVEDKLEVVASPALLNELERVLARPKIRQHVDATQAREYVERIRRHALMVDDPSPVPAVTRDPEDDYLIALARRERVGAIISGDLDLREAGLDDPPVWTPREAGDRVSGEQSS